MRIWDLINWIDLGINRIFINNSIMMMRMMTMRIMMTKKKKKMMMMTMTTILYFPLRLRASCCCHRCCYWDFWKFVWPCRREDCGLRRGRHAAAAKVQIWRLRPASWAGGSWARRRARAAWGGLGPLREREDR